MSSRNLWISPVATGIIPVVTDQLTSRERRQVERLGQGSRLVESIAVASLSLRKLRKDLPRGLLYRSYEEFFLKHGRLFTPRSFPSKYRKWRGKPKACLYNAVELALSFPKLDYVEGYALPAKGLPLPIPHSWCVDDEGKVVDPTWHKVVGLEYFGLAFDKGLLREQHPRVRGDNYTYPSATITFTHRS